MVIASEEAGFSKTVDVGHFFRTRAVCDARERNIARYSKTITQLRSTQGSWMIRNILRATKIGPVLADKYIPLKKRKNNKVFNFFILLCSPCVPDIHRLLHFFGQCRCALLSAPLLMRARHSLHITIKAQIQKHIAHWTYMLRAFPYHIRKYTLKTF